VNDELRQGRRSTGAARGESSCRSKIGCSTRRILDAWVYKSSDRPPSPRLQPVTALKWSVERTSRTSRMLAATGVFRSK
jgi:hypothetical protein